MTRTKSEQARGGVWSMKESGKYFSLFALFFLKLAVWAAFLIFGCIFFQKIAGNCVMGLWQVFYFFSSYKIFITKEWLS